MALEKIETNSNAPFNKSKCMVLYDGTKCDNASTEELRIYIPTAVGYIKYVFGHFVNPLINADNWRISVAESVDDNLEKRFPITTTGEWETAVRIENRPDFSGGILHGDEIVTGLSVLLDGTKTTPLSIRELTYFDELKITEASTLLDPNDNKTIIAIHEKEYIFTTDGLVINQKVEWNVAELLSGCYLAMFPISKEVSDVVSFDNDYVEHNTCDLIGTNHQNIKTIKIHSTKNGFYGTFGVATYPTGLCGGDKILITDNGGNSYNKMYFVVCNGHQSSVGEVWESKTIYKLNIAK